MPLFQNESSDLSCEHVFESKPQGWTHFHMNGFAQKVVFTQRQKPTLKWPTGCKTKLLCLSWPTWITLTSALLIWFCFFCYVWTVDWTAPQHSSASVLWGHWLMVEGLWFVPSINQVQNSLKCLTRFVHSLPATINCLLTESELFTGKSHINTLPYWLSDSDVNTAKPKFQILLWMYYPFGFVSLKLSHGLYRSRHLYITDSSLCPRESKIHDSISTCII